MRSAGTSADTRCHPLSYLGRSPHNGRAEHRFNRLIKRIAQLGDEERKWNTKSVCVCEREREREREREEGSKGDSVGVGLHVCLGASLKDTKMVESSLRGCWRQESLNEDAT